MFGPFPFEALRSGRLAKGAGPGPKAQGTHNAPAGEKDHPQLGKNSKIDRHVMGNSLLLMPLNFQHKFITFLQLH